MSAKANADREIVIERIINAPRDLVFSMIADTNHIEKWYGPSGFSVTTETREFKVGGSWKFTMHGPDGRNYPNIVTYKEIVPSQRIVHDHGGDDGKVAFEGFMTFEDAGKGKTKVTFRTQFPTKEARDFVAKNYGAIEGAEQNLRKLEDYLHERYCDGTKPFVIKRTFKAPLDLMWKMWTDPEHSGKWFGPKGSNMKFQKMDLRPGGTNHYCLSYSGHDMWGMVWYREVVKPTRLVYVQAFSNEKGEITTHPMSPTWPREMITTVTFSEHMGYTTVRIEWLPINATKEELDTFETGRAGMNQGWGGSLDQLGEYIAQQL